MYLKLREIQICQKRKKKLLTDESLLNLFCHTSPTSLLHTYGKNTYSSIILKGFYNTDSS